MSADPLDPRTVRMPDLAPGDWLNTQHPLSKEQLRGRVVVIDFWDYTCVNCIRTLPYLTEWHRRYEPLGLTVIGIHAPEFRFARSRRQVEQAIEAQGLGYPVLLDNAYANWDRFAVRAWPTKVLVDAGGYVRARVQGEGRYAETERMIQTLLREVDPSLELPAPLDPLRPEDRPGAVCYRTTPELYAGYSRGSLGNEPGYAAANPMVYALPPAPERVEPHFYAGGIWRAGPESFAFAGRDGGRIVLPYHAAGVNAVLSPSADPVEVALDLRPGDALPMVEVWLDGMPLVPGNAGADIEYDDGGLSYVNVERPRMYALVETPEHGRHELELVFRASGLALYAFTFTSCVRATSG